MRIPSTIAASFALILAAALSGCAGPGGYAGGFGPPTHGTGIPGFSLSSRALASGEFVEVEVRHRSLRHRVEQVALVGPKGRRHVSRDVRTERERIAPARPGGHIGIAGGSGGAGIFTGIGITFPLGSWFRNPTYRTRALVRVPDPARYRADPTAWRVAVVMGRRYGTPRVIERPAPEMR